MMHQENPTIRIEGHESKPHVNMKKIHDNYCKKREAYEKEIQKGVRTVKMNLQIGDDVLIYKNPPGNKLKAKWREGYKITGVILPDAYLVAKGGASYRVNKKHVKIDHSKTGERGVVKQ